LMRRRAKHVREGQAQERKKEGNPAYFGAYVKQQGLAWFSFSLVWITKASSLSPQLLNLKVPTNKSIKKIDSCTNKFRFRKIGLVKSKKAMGRGHV